MATIINAGQTALTITPDTTGALTLQANGTNALQITANGQITTANAPFILTGGQIQFPSTAVPSGDGNCLDDYEEGTWTPTVTSGTGSITTYSITTAKYTKIGNFVFIDLVVYVANIGTAGGNCTFTLPFTAATLCGVYGREYNNAGYGLQGAINGTTATGYVFNTKTDNGSAWTGGNGLAFGIGCMYPIS